MGGGSLMKGERAVVLAFLQALLPVTDADMLSVTDPKLCYILDGILFVYAVIITALFVKEKLSKDSAYQSPSQDPDDLYHKLSRAPRDEYDSLGAKKTATDIEMGGTNQHRRKKPQDRIYTPLQRDMKGETYSEIGKKGERRRGKGTDAVYQGLSTATKDTYDTLHMQPLPPY